MRNRFLKIFKLLLALWLGVNTIAPVSAAVPQAELADAMQSLYHFHFAEADQIISKMEQQFPDHFLPFVVRSQYYWWKIITHHHVEDLQIRYIASLDRSRQLINISLKAETVENDWEKIFYKTNIYASMARLDLMNGDHFKSLRHMRQAVDYLSLSLELTDSFQPFLLTGGLYNYIAGYGERRYPFFRVYSLRYPRGNTERGIKQLTLAAESRNELIDTEARYFLMKIFLELENDYNAALVHSTWLTERYPMNLIFLYHHYQIANKLNYTSLASTIEIDYLRAIEENPQLTQQQRKHFRDLIR